MFLGGMRADDRPINAHSELAQYGVPYYAYPPPDSEDVLRYSPKCDQTRALTRGDRNVVFVGQVPRLLPLPYVPWALDLLVEDYAVAWVLQTQQNGCAKAWTETDAQVEELVRRNKLLLFDVCGVWVGRSDEQRARIQHYQSTMQMRGPLDGRVPRHGIIIERLRPPQSTGQRQDAGPAMRAMQPSGANIHAVPFQPSGGATVTFVAPPQYVSAGARQPMQQVPVAVPHQRTFAATVPISIGRPFGPAGGQVHNVAFVPPGQQQYATVVETPSYLLRQNAPDAQPTADTWTDPFKFGLFDGERTFQAQ
jgi:hypothetical protein